MKKLISVVGARPNFMKVAPIHFAFQNHKDRITHLICHTGQHYDAQMSKIFFEELELPQPDFYLGIGSGSHAEQTAAIMVAFEKIILKEKPDLVIVVGDVNSTIACSLVASKLNVKIAHVEAGLRSFDRGMPEEINRILTDAISDYLFVTENSGLENLRNEGIQDSRIFFTGNVMIDSLVRAQQKIDSSEVLTKYVVDAGEFILVTLHRPSNVDNQEQLTGLLAMLSKYSERYRVIFPVHPRTRANMMKFGLGANQSPGISFTDPLGYIDFLQLLKNAKLIITDSGGVQEESTYLGVPCITLRTTTERPVTVDMGTNYLTGPDVAKVDDALNTILSGKHKKGTIPPLWDGKAAERICAILVRLLYN
jgi:UDP-N-acetylglucosamine 2-epimerase (non-hydrolysing)